MNTTTMTPTPTSTARPTLAVWKFASCDGCQLTLLDCEAELLAIATAYDLRVFLEAGLPDDGGEYDISLVEGSITNEHDAARLAAIRARSRVLVALGACATGGGVQAGRNGHPVDEMSRAVYPRPELLPDMGPSTPLGAHVHVDLELRGCPISRHELLDVIVGALVHRRPPATGHSVCAACKAAGTTCLPVAHRIPCLGPMTHGGCGALCPSIGRGCFGCFGPSESANRAGVRALVEACGGDPATADRAVATWHAVALGAREVPR